MYYVVEYKDNPIVCIIKADKLKYKDRGNMAIFTNEDNWFWYQIVAIIGVSEVKNILTAGESRDDLHKLLDRMKLLKENELNVSLDEDE